MFVKYQIRKTNQPTNTLRTVWPVKYYKALNQYQYIDYRGPHNWPHRNLSSISIPFINFIVISSLINANQTKHIKEL